MTKYLENNFKARLHQALNLITDYGVEYQKIGLFGSYARGTCTGSSDIDLCLVVKEKPARKVSGSLREDCELIGVDVVFVTREYLDKDTSRFAEKLRRDWRDVDEECKW